MSFKNNSGYTRIFVDTDGSGNEILKAELKNNDGTKRIAILAEV